MFGLPNGSLGERTWKGCKEVARRWSGIGGKKSGARSRRKPILLEGLEDRALMATAGVDYVVTGYKWANPAKITYSIVPDGVQWISGISTLNSAFDAKFGDGVWEREIARALATWQAAANINIVPVDDGAYRENVLGISQGDPRFGDIRIGGDAMPGNVTTLAQTYYPPPQGSTAGGDVEINLNVEYGIGSKFDLFSVILHETGHSLGLGHPTSTEAVMRPVYGGLVKGLDDGDLVGIRQIYGARSDDMYQSQGFGLSASKPIDVTSVLANQQTSTSTGASLTDVGDVEWFSFVAPSYSSGSWQVTASASSSSMLSAKVMVYDDAGNLIGQASDPSRWSTDVTASMGSIVPGRRYYAAVTGATDDVFAVGAYTLTVGMSKAPTPVAPPVTPTTPPKVPTTPTSPTTPTTPTNPITNPPATGPIYPTSPMVLPDRFEVNNSTATATRLGRVVQTSLGGLTLPTADVDFFNFQAGGQGLYQVSAGGATIQIINSRGKVVAQGNGTVAVQATRNASLYVKVQAPGTDAVGDYTLSIGQVVAPRRRPMFARPMARQSAAPAAAWGHAFRAGRA